MLISFQSEQSLDVTEQKHCELFVQDKSREEKFSRKWKRLICRHCKVLELFLDSLCVFIDTFMGELNVKMSANTFKKIGND